MTVDEKDQARSSHRVDIVGGSSSKYPAILYSTRLSTDSRIALDFIDARLSVYSQISVVVQQIIDAPYHPAHPDDTAFTTRSTLGRSPEYRQIQPGARSGSSSD